ncbi:hypothetical protein [Nonomuraea diastatica]|uniref:hypothetical protein n=1 Tax=Nonomuraea diastatica TaxID=1848329 RepID=UPI001C700560|nr:hypothetical protein [Nonomuraea diastatica]
MKRGINYDTGFLPGDDLSRRSFDLEDVERDMRTIARDLHCDSVRISGGDPGRVTAAAERVVAAGLEVWFAPFPVDLTEDEMSALFAESAERAEALRRAGGDVVLVTGCEITAFGHGFIKAPAPTRGRASAVARRGRCRKARCATRGSRSAISRN